MINLNVFFLLKINVIKGWDISHIIPSFLTTKSSSVNQFNFFLFCHYLSRIDFMYSCANISQVKNFFFCGNLRFFLNFYGEFSWGRRKMRLEMCVNMCSTIYLIKTKLIMAYFFKKVHYSLATLLCWPV